jgi:uncharacterized protein (TIGR02246 family)
MMRTAAPLFLLAAATLVGCRPATPDLDTERRAIMEADRAWVTAAGQRDLEKALSYWTEDATLLPPDMPPIKGKPAIREYVAAGFQTPGFSVSWEPGEVTVAENGGMAYQVTTNQFTVPDSTGTLHTSVGKAVVVWRKDADGAWRAVIDTWNGAGAGAAVPAATN